MKGPDLRLKSVENHDFVRASSGREVACDGMYIRRAEGLPPPSRLYSGITATDSQTEAFLRAMGHTLDQGERPRTSRFQSGLVGDKQIELELSASPDPHDSSQQTRESVTTDSVKAKYAATARQQADSDAAADSAPRASTIDADRFRRFLQDVPMLEGLVDRLALLLDKEEETGTSSGLCLRSLLPHPALQLIDDDL